MSRGNGPVHLAVVMDGNGRWAKKRHLPRVAGHKSGVDATRKLVENCVRHGISILTIFAFSSENWHRPKAEVSSIMSLFVSTLSSDIKKLHKQNVRVRFIGDRSRFSEKLQQSIEASEALTGDNTGLQLNIAANYGGRWDIVDAVRQVARRLRDGRLDVDEIDESMIDACLSTAGMPDPDLFIRTGGEQRISNFLLWQSAYAELYFVDTLWPDFGDEELQQALTWYQGRQRRFGKTGEQVESPGGGQDAACDDRVGEQV